MRKLALLALLASFAAASVQDCRDVCLPIARDAYKACMADGNPQHICWNMFQKTWHECTHACASQ